MRLFYEIICQPKTNKIRVFTRKSLQNAEFVTISILKEKSDFVTDDITIGEASVELSQVIRGLSQFKFSTPTELINEIRKASGKQVVWDEVNGRYRNVSTMKEGKSSFEAVGLGVTVTADDEEIAQRRLQNQVTKAMVANPAKAKKFAEWFEKDRPVKEVESGSVPEFSKHDVWLNKGEKIWEGVTNLNKPTKKKAVIKSKK